MFKVTVKVDTNDADYNELTTAITSKEWDELRPILTAISKFKPYKAKSESGLDWTHNHNWPSGEYSPREDLGEKTPEEIYAGVLTLDQIQMFTDYCPFGEHGFHSVKEVTILEVVGEEVWRF